MNQQQAFKDTFLKLTPREQAEYMDRQYREAGLAALKAYERLSAEDLEALKSLSSIADDELRRAVLEDLRERLPQELAAIHRQQAVLQMISHFKLHEQFGHPSVEEYSNAVLAELQRAKDGNG